MAAKRPRMCARCRHAHTFHGRELDKPCGAMGCSKGDDGKPCPRFIEPNSAGNLIPEFRSGV